LRWQHRKRGSVSPVESIPLAEKSGLILGIVLWVLRTACFETVSWSKPLNITVNVASPQLAHPEFLKHLSDILFESQLAPKQLELVVTEASLIHDQAHSQSVLNQIEDIGILIAMDDFGTGYSSLATLQTFPFDKNKIDRSFFKDSHLDRRRAAIVRSNLSLGEAFGIPLLAEGVKTKDELNFLTAEGCDFVQGFHFGKPISLSATRTLVMDQDMDTASGSPFERRNCA
jgi:EAL domain-containing protein (putative c-di-GMP-specific phosphodiesterase class I)